MSEQDIVSVYKFSIKGKIMIILPESKTSVYPE